MNPRRIARLEQQIKQRIAEVLLRELADPRIGLVTITRVELDKEFTLCRAYWSVLGGDDERAESARTLARARAFIQREVGRTLHTRTTPRLEFEFDQRIAGAVHMHNLLNEIRQEREQRERGAPSDPAADQSDRGRPTADDDDRTGDRGS